MLSIVLTSLSALVLALAASAVVAYNDGGVFVDELHAAAWIKFRKRQCFALCEADFEARIDAEKIPELKTGALLPLTAQQILRFSQHNKEVLCWHHHSYRHCRRHCAGSADDRWLHVGSACSTVLSTSNSAICLAYNHKTIEAECEHHLRDALYAQNNLELILGARNGVVCTQIQQYYTCANAVAERHCTSDPSITMAGHVMKRQRDYSVNDQETARAAWLKAHRIHAYFARFVRESLHGRLVSAETLAACEARIGPDQVYLAPIQAETVKQVNADWLKSGGKLNVLKGSSESERLVLKPIVKVDDTTDESLELEAQVNGASGEPVMEKIGETVMDKTEEPVSSDTHDQEEHPSATAEDTHVMPVTAAPVAPEPTTMTITAMHTVDITAHGDVETAIAEGSGSGHEGSGTGAVNEVPGATQRLTPRSHVVYPPKEPEFDAMVAAAPVMTRLGSLITLMILFYFLMQI